MLCGNINLYCLRDDGMFELFYVFTKVGLLTFGGGSSAAPVIRKEAVENKGYVSEEEFIDIIASANMLPGPSMAQMAAIIGYKQKGILGALIASIAIIMPMVLLFSIFAVFLVEYADPDLLTKIVEPAIMVISASLLLLSKDIFLAISPNVNKIYAALISVISFVLIVLFGIHPSILIISVFVGVFIYGSIKSAI